MGCVGLRLGLQGPRLPTTLCQRSTSSEWSLRVCVCPPHHHPRPPPPSLTVSARLPATCPDYAQQKPWLREEQLLGRLGEEAEAGLWP